MKNEVNLCKTGGTEEENRKQDTQVFIKKKKRLPWNIGKSQCGGWRGLPCTRKNKEPKKPEIYLNGGEAEF